METRVGFADDGVDSIDRDLLLAVVGPEAAGRQKEEALTVLSRAAQRRQMDVESEEGRREIQERWTTWMTEVLFLDLPGMAEVAIRVAQQSSSELNEIRDPLGRALAEALRAADDLELAASLRGSMPPTQRTVVLREAALVVTEAALARLGEGRDERASLLNDLSNRLSGLGRRGEALSAIEEAVGALGPFFHQHPPAFAAWMRIMVGNYVKRASDADQEVDMELLRPIVAVLQRLEQSSGDSDT